MTRYISQLKIPIKGMAYMDAIEAHCLVDTKTKIKWAIKITLIKYLKTIIKTFNISKQLKLLAFLIGPFSLSFFIISTHFFSYHPNFKSISKISPKIT
jgi:hypothetical protein